MSSLVVVVGYQRVNVAASVVVVQLAMEHND